LLAGRNQLQWVVLLLAVAVVLPTVCLLWFMSQVVKNERLVVRQKLAALYQDKLAEASQKTAEAWAKNVRFLDGLLVGAEPAVARKVGPNPYDVFTKMVIEHNFAGLLICGADGNRIYPRSADDSVLRQDTTGEFAEAWQLEFNEQAFAQAAELYDRKTSSNDEYVRLTAIVGKSRCLAKLGRVDEAVEECKKAAFSPIDKTTNTTTLVLIENARLLLLNFLKQGAKRPDSTEYWSTTRTELFIQTVNEIVSTLYGAGEQAILPANQNLFLARKVLQTMQENPFVEGKVRLVKAELERIIAAEELTIAIAEDFPAARLAGEKTDSLFRVNTAKHAVYGISHKTDGTTFLLLLSDNDIALAVGTFVDTFEGSGLACRIMDDSGGLVAGIEKPEDKPFVTAPVGSFLPGWKVELYLAGGDFFEKAADRQIAVYTWTGALVILLILGAGGFAAQVVSRQIRLNKMKNDFIATVSHELKTPLASMRVLVDTLLEGNIKNEQQTEEYLRLTSKENERLSRMIDNFLTFSRMERNKQAFEIRPVSPALIAQSAVESVKTKFSAAGCRFSIQVDEKIPDVLADHDAVVTILVNLLDNAYKYTYDDKQISLRVFAEPGNVCFEVVDNGVGLARRHIKKIFERFYQVDRSLSRRAEGCGLGLSIVKYIVDAHKGEISVESRPEKGSAFTVRIPAAEGSVSQKGSAQ